MLASAGGAAGRSPLARTGPQPLPRRPFFPGVPVPQLPFRRPLALVGVLAVLAVLVLGGEAWAVDPYAELVDGAPDFVHDAGRAGGFHLPEITCSGAALLDYDGDGDLDLYLVQSGPLPGAAPAGGSAAAATRGDRLFRNDLSRGTGGERPDGPALRFTDVTAEAGLAGETGYGCGVAAGDYDNDGRTDLFVAGFGGDRLLRNAGPGADGRVRFEEAALPAEEAAPWSASAAFVDYDADGWLDLYVARYVDYDLARAKACRTAAGAPDYCDPASYPGVADRLLRNLGPAAEGAGGEGRTRFADVTRAAGIAAVRSKSLGVVAADFDGDGRTDFYVTADGVPNQLWIQTDGGRFEDRALFAGCAVNGRGQAEASMGVVAADDDGDGDLDLFLTHLTGETNTLYRADGAGGFTDASTPSGLAVPSVPMTGWGVGWIDYDNDGWLDLAIANGAVRTLPALAAAGDPFPFHQPNQLFRNLGGEGRPGPYAEVEAGEAFARSEVSRALAAGDLDDDGDPDLVVANADGPVRVLLDRVGQDAGWLGLRLVGDPAGTGAVRDMLGARVELLRSGRSAVLRLARADGSFAASGDPRVVFGLGAESGPQRVRVTWPDGSVETFGGLPAGRYTTLRQGGGESGAGEPAGGAER